MPRFRRYRLFLVCAVLLTIVLFRLSKTGDLDRTSKVVFDALGDPGRPASFSTGDGLDSSSTSDSPPSKANVDIEKLAHSSEPLLPKPVEQKGTLHATATKASPTQETAAPPTVPQVVIPDRKLPSASDSLKEDDGTDEGLHYEAPGKVEPVKFSPSPSPIHWVKPIEHFPVASEALIHLPTGRPIPMPQIQHTFSAETAEAKAKREQRLENVKREFKKAWNGYKTHAWMHDELSPSSGKHRDPFCGWAATLVDSLDTLWIMGLQEEFREAVQAVENIDFTTTPRANIPVFETTIRYLGGLLAAYDVSGAQYKVLLDKAVELGEILMGAFDTPNRMPKLFYQWRPTFASQANRAGTKANFAELGSLSMEFTRLAQLTKEPKYYDAVARITNALVDWQKRGTKVRGVFPHNVDASGCNRTATRLLRSSSDSETDVSSNVEGYVPPMPKTVQEMKPRKGRVGKEIDAFELQIIPGEPSKGHLQLIEAESKKLSSRQPPDESEILDLGETVAPRDDPVPTMTPHSGMENWDCVPQGLDGAKGKEEFSMGGGQDSTYEYFTKQWLLLGGLEEKYRTLYLDTMDAVRKHMLYRPMVPGSRDILFSGKVSTTGRPNDLKFEAEVTHLTCFLGGMVGMGSKIFGLEADMEVAKKLSDGCVWAYEATNTGLMPEVAHAVPCESAADCPWDKSRWWRWLDPLVDRREEDIRAYEENKVKLAAKKEAEIIAAQRKLDVGKAATSAINSDIDVDSPPPISTRYEADVAANDTAISEPLVRKRQVDKVVPNPVHDFIQDVKDSVVGVSAEEQKFQQKLEDTKAELEPDLPGRTVKGPLPTLVATATAAESKEDTVEDPTRPLTHEEYVTGRLARENIPPGFAGVDFNFYILRPEAIESVWYMYRITGDTTWQEKGWTMFENIIAATNTTYGHTAVTGVTSNKPEQIDEMESFWLAETLKYFYLLYSTPDTISLDEWVLNTEAHPFKRPV